MSRRLDTQDVAGWTFAAPALAAVMLLFALPTAAALLLSLTDFDIYALADVRNLRWMGGANYGGLLDDPAFLRALGNTMLFTALGMPATIGASLAVALLLDHQAVRWRPAWRLLLFAPYVTTLVATAIAWRYVLDTRFGLINRALTAIGLPPVDWLGDPRTSVPAVVLFVTWKVFAYNMIVFGAALTTVPRDLIDAARLDGAGAWARFRHVTLPAIRPVVVLAALLNAAGFLQIFSEPYIMTQGGPAQSTQTLLYFMFEQGFRWWNLGVASAVAVVTFALTLLLTAWPTRVGRARGWL